ncbi:MAG: TetR/AcrR family transcriptional regulator [Steroidobacter sp.]
MNTRERLVECAFGELERSGIEGFSLRSVGNDAGLSAMAVYRHFKNKNELLRVVGEVAFEEWRRRVEAIKETTLEKWFHKVVRAYVEFALDQPARFDVCFVLKTEVERIYPDDFRAGKSPVISLTMQRIEQAQRNGELNPGDSLEIALFAWAQLHGLVMLHRSGRFALGRAAFLSLCKRCGSRILQALKH